ncbi:hypothetical protein LCGC14_1690860 [marine sediment metagenome]|uniref:Uncharacterized protein n=1 Tax=marine sediment metagenome TaxID=412755 RepID=A0A0F9HL87_9ZZZZ
MSILWPYMATGAWPKCWLDSGRTFHSARRAARRLPWLWAPVPVYEVAQMTGFAEFWALAKHIRSRMPNGGRPPAERAWNKAVKEGAVPDEIIAGYLGYEDAMDACDTDYQFRCMASTFVNQWRWEQYLDENAAERYLEGCRPNLQVVK